MPSAAAADRITGRLCLAGWLIPHVHALLLKHYCGHAPVRGGLPDPAGGVRSLAGARGGRVAARCTAAAGPRSGAAGQPGPGPDGVRERLPGPARADRSGPLRASGGDGLRPPARPGSFAAHTPEFPRLELNGVAFPWRGAGESLSQVARRVVRAGSVRRPPDLPADVYRETPRPAGNRPSAWAGR